MPLGECLPGVGNPALDRSGRRTRFRMENAYADRTMGHVDRVYPSPDRGNVTGRRVRTYIGLGANVGDADATLASAVATLDDLPGARLRGVSRLYATVPVGVTDQPEFRNAAVALDVPALADPATGALALLSTLKRLERDFGRRPRKRWGPRELDLDLLVFGRARLAIERPAGARSLDAGPPGGPLDPSAVANLLVVPHPAADARLFVLAPLADLVPGLVPPGWGRSIETAQRQRLAAEGPDAVRPVATWDQAARSWRPIQPRLRTGNVAPQLPRSSAPAGHGP